MRFLTISESNEFLAILRGLKERRLELLLALFACGGILYLPPKVLSLHGTGEFALDFRMVWLAGKLWVSGQNPYGPEFARQYLEVFGPGVSMYWVYPPYWYPLAIPFGLLPFTISNLAWWIFNFLLLIAATHLTAQAIAQVSGRRYAPILFVGIAFVCFMQATSMALFLGQTPILVYFGFAAMISGLLKDRPVLLVIGLVFLALKPHIGLVVFSAVFVLPQYRLAVIAAGGLCLLATVPILLGGDYLATIQGFLVKLERYPFETPAGNTPPNLTGLIHILDYLFTFSTRVFVNTLLLILGALVVSMAGLHCSPLSSRAEAKNAGRMVAALILMISSVCFLIPLHAYDVVSLAVVAMMIFAAPLAGRWLIALGLLMSIRPGNISNALGIVHPASQAFPESLFLSVALLMIFLGALWSAASPASESAG